MEHRRRLRAGERSRKCSAQRSAPQTRTRRISADTSRSTASWAMSAGASVGSTARVLVPVGSRRDRKSTRLNSSHLVISYAVFCLKKKKNLEHTHGVDLRLQFCSELR